jgi:hypothetical protein
MRRFLLAFLCLGLTAGARAAGPTTTATSSKRPTSRPLTTNERIEHAIERGKAYVLAQQHQKSGSWDIPSPGREPRPNAQGFINVADIENSSQWGGTTALAAYALLATGESPREPHIAAAIEFLKQANLRGTYALAMRAQVWNSMPTNRRKEFAPFAARDRDLLLKNERDPPFRGLFRYSADKLDGYDHSASQFGVLGLWACANMGADVRGQFWATVEESWRRNQNPTGGWNYSQLMDPKLPDTPAMTAAGIATLFITLDMLHSDVGGECRGNISHKPIDAGVQWISDHFDRVFDPTDLNTWPYYTLYGIERIGLASGYRFLGTHDWFKFGVERLLATQHPNGSWADNPIDTCFALLFLARGRNPLVMSKLQYSIADPSGKPKEGNWDQRPRDCANFCRWLGHEMERELNWQIVNLSGPVEDLHDGPILLIEGNQPLKLTAQEEEKLRQFALQGGIILGNADCASPAFTTEFKKLGTRLFPAYEFRELPANHLIYTNLFDRKRWKAPMSVQGISNGARELMLLIPNGDAARFWQTATYGGHEPAFELMANLFLYATERKDPRHRGDSWVIAPLADVKPTASIKVARLEYGGNWDPEPAGWKRLAAVLRNEDAIELTAVPIKLGDGKLAASGCRVAHLTGTGSFTLSAAQRSELKEFLESGGGGGGGTTLIADAAGGDSAAATSLETEIAALTPSKLRVLPRDHPALAHMEVSAEDITLRPFAARQLGRASGPRVRGADVAGRTAVILYSPEDLSVGIVGQAVDGIVGYTPASATAVMKSLVLFKSPPAPAH